MKERKKLEQRVIIEVYLGARLRSAERLQSELERVSNFKVGDAVDSAEELLLVYSECGNPSGVAAQVHIADPVAAALQWEHSAAEPGRHQIGGLQPLFHQLLDVGHLAIQIGIPISRFLGPMVLCSRRGQRELGQI